MSLQDEDDVVRPASGNPRRTKRIQFTCNMCGSTTTKMVNPHAWEKGTVFAQCSGCGVKHKLIGEMPLNPSRWTVVGPTYPIPVSQSCERVLLRQYLSLAALRASIGSAVSRALSFQSVTDAGIVYPTYLPCTMGMQAGRSSACFPPTWSYGTLMRCSGVCRQPEALP